MDAQRTGAKPIQVCSLPSGARVSRRMPSGRTQRSALPPRDCWVHSNVDLGLDAQRLRNSEFDSATAHSVRSTSGGPEGAQEGSRGFRDSGTPGQPSPTRPEPRQGFQRDRHNALLMVTSSHHAAAGRRTLGFQPDGSRATGPQSPQSGDISGPRATNHWDQNPQSAPIRPSRGKGPEPAPRERGPPCLLSTFSTPLSRPPAAGPPCPLQWAFNRKPPPRWAAKPRRPKNPIRAHPPIARQGSRTSATGPRTSVSAQWASNR